MQEMALLYMKNYLQINKFSHLNGLNDIVFCKTDYILQDFEKISKLNRDITFITGNSDYGITDDIVKNSPKNIKIWYAQNALSNHKKIQPLPIGIENKEPSVRLNHGVGYFDRVSQKENIFNTIDARSIEPKKFMYSNFVVHNNPTHRSIAKEISVQQDYIDWEQPDLSLEQLFLRFLEYKMVLCPVGNGIDTHRLWEVLYCNRIPVTIKVGDFKIYSLYEELPIVILDSYSELLNQERIEEKYQKAVNKKYDTQILETTYWENKIRNTKFTKK